MTEESIQEGKHHRLYSALALIAVAALIILVLFVELAHAADFTLPDNLTPATANAELLIINPLSYSAVESLCNLNAAEASNSLFIYQVAERTAIMQIKNEWCA